MSGRRRRALEREFKRLHQGNEPPKTAWEPKNGEDRSPGYMLSMHRGLKKHPERFGIGLQGRALREAQIGVIRTLHAREPLPEEPKAEPAVCASCYGSVPDGTCAKCGRQYPEEARP